MHRSWIAIGIRQVWVVRTWSSLAFHTDEVRWFERLTRNRCAITGCWLVDWRLELLCLWSIWWQIVLLSESLAARWLHYLLVEALIHVVRIHLHLRLIICLIDTLWRYELRIVLRLCLSTKLLILFLHIARFLLIDLLHLRNCIMVLLRNSLIIILVLLLRYIK